MKSDTSESQSTPPHKAKLEDRPLYEAARRVLLASVGALALAQDEIEDFINKLVERGEIADKEGFKLVKEIKERRAKNIHRVEDQVSQRLDAALGRMNLPTKADMDALSDKIAALSQKIEELKKK
jgi:polyhydroxyalkanoate synthesis regulator phasin